MKYDWCRKTTCKKEPTPAEKRLQLLKDYTFLLPHKKKFDVFGKKKKWPEDVFPDDFRYQSTCKRRSYTLSKYFEDYLDTVEPPKLEVVPKPKVRTAKPTKSETDELHRVSEINPLMVDLEKKRIANTSRQVLQRRKHAKSSLLWSLESMDMLIRKGMVHEEKMEELYNTQVGSAIFTKHDFNPYKVYNWGEKGSGLHSMGPIQDFRTLRETCTENKVLFEDPYFPANEKSLCYSNWSHGVVAWKRPLELCINPKLFVGDISRFDVHQGFVGNCWMLAALCSLTMKRKLFFQVVPLDQAFDEMYAGIFHFRLWNDGKWIDVVIDDRLPVDADNKLHFVQSSTSYEFWPALLEKAYAKMQGTYEHIEAGLCSEAFIEFTGGLVEVVVFKDDPEAFAKMRDAWDRDSLICVNTRSSHTKNPEEITPEGIVLGHAYTVTKVIDASFRALSGPQIKEQLLRIRNPWGAVEWKGAWSERSHEWIDVPDRLKKEIGFHIADDGEFWISFKDAVRFFADVHICHVSPSTLGNAERWILSLMEGEWVKGVSAGGSRLEPTYHMNPQYLLRIFDEDENTHVIISLLSKNRRRLKHINHTYLSVNVSTYPISKDFPKPLPQMFFRTMHSLDENMIYECSREVMCSYDLLPGFYVVVPSTWDNGEGEFLLRFYSEKKIKVCPYDDQIGIDDEIYTQGYNVEYDQHTEEVDDDEDLKIEKLFIEKDKIGIHDRQEILDKFLELSGEEEVINWIGLKSLLEFSLEKIIGPEGLSKDICRSLIALYDTNCIGALYLVQFFILWTEIIFWVQNFDRHKDSNNEMCVFTLRNTLCEAGFTSNMHLLNLIMHRYGNKKGTLKLQEFLMVVIKFKHMIETFTKKMSLTNHVAKFNINQFVEVALYS